MKKNIILCCVIFVIAISSCGKEECDVCPSDITQNINPNDFHYQSVFCEGDNFERIYNTEEAYFNDSSCNRTQSIPFPLNFEGVIVLQGIKVPYLAQSGSAYEKEVLITADSCSKSVIFHFQLTTIDTFQRTDNLRQSVLVLLENIDSTYTINFSHEIIPFGE